MATATWRSELFRAARANLAPGLLLQVVAIGLVASYYLIPALRPMWDALARLKTGGGFWYAAIATALFAALIPTAIEAVRGRWTGDRRWRRLIALSVFWAWKGVEVDLLYRMQAVWFGNGHDAGTIAFKVVVDQFIYNPLWAAWTSVLCYRWMDARCSWSAFRAGLDRSVWTRTIPTVLFSTWVVWVPAVAIIYCLPLPLQVPLFNLVLCFWVLMLAMLARR